MSYRCLDLEVQSEYNAGPGSKARQIWHTRYKIVLLIAYTNPNPIGQFREFEPPRVHTRTNS